MREVYGCGVDGRSRFESLVLLLSLFRDPTTHPGRYRDCRAPTSPPGWFTPTTFTCVESDPVSPEGRARHLSVPTPTGTGGTCPTLVCTYTERGRRDVPDTRLYLHRQGPGVAGGTCPTLVYTCAERDPVPPDKEGHPTRHPLPVPLIPHYRKTPGVPRDNSVEGRSNNVDHCNLGTGRVRYTLIPPKTRQIFGHGGGETEQGRKSSGPETDGVEPKRVGPGTRRTEPTCHDRPRPTTTGSPRGPSDPSGLWGRLKGWPQRYFSDWKVRVPPKDTRTPERTLQGSHNSKGN